MMHPASVSKLQNYASISGDIQLDKVQYFHIYEP